MTVVEPDAGEVRALMILKKQRDQAWEERLPSFVSEFMPTAYAFVESLIRQLLARLDVGDSSATQVKPNSNFTQPNILIFTFLFEWNAICTR